MTTQKTSWVLDPAHSEITFKVKHMMISNVRGEFKSFNALVDGEDFETADISVNIDTGSVFTNSADRDNHLKSADFFDSENHPAMTFEASGLKKTGDYKYELSGLMTIKGKSKPVTFDVEFGGINKDPWGQDKAGFSLETKINRKDWELNWNAALETGGVLVSEEVRIQAEIQFLKQAS